jgi:hypothetical protein
MPFFLKMAARVALGRYPLRVGSLSSSELVNPFIALLVLIEVPRRLKTFFYSLVSEVTDLVPTP